jgi:hypothetical protein
LAHVCERAIRGRSVGSARIDGATIVHRAYALRDDCGLKLAAGDYTKTFSGNAALHPLPEGAASLANDGSIWRVIGKVYHIPVLAREQG